MWLCWPRLIFPLELKPKYYSTVVLCFNVSHEKFKDIDIDRSCHILICFFFDQASLVGPTKIVHLITLYLLHIDEKKVSFASTTN